jgi:hypothetical protein
MPSAGVLAVAGATLTLAVANALAAPPFTGNDEAAHVAYALAVADGRLPLVTDRSAASPIGPLPAGRLIYTANHPPLYYALAGPPAAALADAGHAGAALRFARLVNAVLATLAVLATAALAARLAPGRRRAPVIAAAVAGLVPAYGFVAGFAYNDGLALAAAAGLLWAALVVHQDGASRRRLLAVALLAAAAALARASALPAVAAAAVLCATGRGRRRDALAPLAAALVAGGWFYARNVDRYGDVTGGGYLLRLLHRPTHGSTAGALVDPGFWSQMAADAWGRFAPLPGPLEAVLAVAALACIAWQLRRPSVTWLVLAGYALVVLVAVARFYAEGGGAHGRYLYPLLAVAGPAVGIVADRFRIVSAVALVAAVALCVRHLHGVLVRYVKVPHHDWVQIEDAALRRAGVPLHAAVLALLVLALAACTAVAVRDLLDRTPVP